ncbi:MAG: hypothetical protein AAGA66_04470 [Bacteroidota bacterium]
MEKVEGCLTGVSLFKKPSGLRVEARVTTFQVVIVRFRCKAMTVELDFISVC